MAELPGGKRLLDTADRRVRSLAAGIGLRELRAILRGDPSTERPNPRYKAHTESFVLHLRPRTYPLASTWLTHTFRLGFFTTFLFVVEVITGFVLMIYYVPTPEGAYSSIQRLLTAVPFGELMRDVHRLAAEGMVIFALLHMLRTFITGSYKRERSFTWLTGVVLLLVTLFLSFSGYLLPWDQLAYWAVTIGTSMAAAVPVVGPGLNVLLRGSETIGADGLLRFYQLHVILLPLVVFAVLSVHYYRVARKHGISLPARIEEGTLSSEARQVATRRVDYLPDLLTHEAFLVTLGLLALVASALLWYDAPLESHANPQRTPLLTEAPWFFLWLQGLLKLGNKTLMGVIVPLTMVLVLLAVPYLDRNPWRSARRRPVALALCAVSIAALLVLSAIGRAGFGIALPPATRISYALAPEEGAGPLQRVPYSALTAGVYEAGRPDPAGLDPAFQAVLLQLQEQVESAEAAGELAEAHSLLVVEDWQRDLKRVTLRITWTDSQAAGRITHERTIFLHRQRDGAP